ncbi:MAG TPA: nucleoside triphosphate pyrophosphohydrolase [candidate division WOR-3 bacterium]|uniref:Nucleoside triphosphate pyrophosphohydrolase n=1 Tax=candidate division WOR-3 bacterium TaxID=2052148 RepID=A0A7V0T3W5_UNCW3|nr:nucleoside triphosphate pyrophosphohydrolase [candidate division WOR-3 bacterium]
MLESPFTNALDELVEVVRRLRAECPWDRAQTVETTRPLVLNEAYELDEALGSADPDAMSEELGDYLFMGLFLADTLRTEHGIRLEDAVQGIIAKLKRRHPHIYGEAEVRDAAHVLEHWERIKQEEKKTRESVLDGLPRSLPALKQAHLMQERCRRVGFDWTDKDDVLDKVVEEVGELREELAHAEPDRARVSDELGDLLFALVNLARHLEVDAESALHDAAAKFGRRFRAVEQDFRGRGRKLEESTLAEMDKVWDEVKRASPTPGQAERPG